MNFKNLSTLNIQIINFLFLIFPLVHIIGPFAINLDVVLISLLGLFFIREIIDLKLSKSFYLIFLFFIVLTVTSFLKSETVGNEEGFLKSLMFLRYFIFLIVIRYLIKNDIIKLKNFLIFSLILSCFISIDIIFQALIGYNFFGFEAMARHNSGMFGDELIAGSYLQKFCLFGLVSLPFIFNELDKKKLTLIFLLQLVFFSGILYSGNRMPFLMYILMIILMIIFIKKLRKTFLIGSLFCILIFILSFQFNRGVNVHWGEFYRSATNTVVNIKKFSFIKYPELEKKKYDNFIIEYNTGKDKKILQEKYKLAGWQSGHQILFMTAIDILNDNIFFGNGIKSFRYVCKTKLYLPNRACETHPHNYYLELLNDTGLVGFLTLFIGGLILFLYIILNHKKINYKDKLIVFCIFILLLLEFFPIKSAGSFYSVGNASFIFFILGILGGLLEKTKSLD